jgi:hypothetical protein
MADSFAHCGGAMAKTAVHYFFLNRVAQMQRGGLRGAVIEARVRAI